MRPAAVLPVVAALVMFAACAALVPAGRPDEPESITLWAPAAASVQLVGDWNEWGGLTSPGRVVDPAVGRMARDGDGNWTAPLPDLPPGRYRYAFLLDGHEWIPDPMNPDVAGFEGMTVSLMTVSD